MVPIYLLWVIRSISVGPSHLIIKELGDGGVQNSWVPLLNIYPLANPSSTSINTPPSSLKKMGTRDRLFLGCLHKGCRPHLQRPPLSPSWSCTLYPSIGNPLTSVVASLPRVEFLFSFVPRAKKRERVAVVCLSCCPR